MEFKIINPTEDSGFLQSIEFNFDELKTELTKRLEKYQGLTYTEESLKDAKADKAGLNKFKEAIETRRKEVKKLCLKPYEDFEIKVKELVALVDEPITAIDTQIKDFEDKRISAKLVDITDLYNSIFDGWQGIIRLERIFNEKWKNATYSMKNINQELQEIFNKVKAEMQTISDMNLKSDIELQVKDVYLQTLDFGKAIQEKNRLEELEKRLQEHTVKQQEKEEIKEVYAAPEPNFNLKNIVYERKFWVKGTKEQLISLGNYMKDNNIEYGGLQ